ncbi:MAG: 5'-nucleotidase C-terminal domain-containing protein [Clostridia bacterium]|nr:5'-nucleotidase C-terminal domain-containing protein [Clostridia bacterium]
MKRIVALLLAVVMVFGLMTSALAADTAKADSIVILHTNDIHCGVESNLGISGVAAYKADMEAANKYVALVDCGDATQGKDVGMVSAGTYVIDMMNKAGYDYAIFGNHEFDYKMPGVRKLVDKADFQYLSCNFTYLGDESDNAVDLDPYAIETYGSVKVAFIGVTTPESFSKSTPAYFKNADGEYIYSFAEGNNGADLYKAVQTAIDGAKAQGADYIIVLGHLGMEDTTPGWTSEDVIKNTTGIDALLDGHSHEAFSYQVDDKDGNKVWLQQTGTELANLGKVVISDGKLTCELVSSENYTKKDETVAKYVRGIFETFEGDYAGVIAKTQVKLSINDETGKRIIRNTETGLGNLCADAYRVMMNADVGIMNGGGIRASVGIGDITKKQLLSVFPWGNLPCKVEVTGQTLLDALELGASKYPGENGGFLHVSGLKYAINESVKSSVKLDEHGEFIKVDGEYRVSDVQILKNGKYQPLDLKKKYTVAGNDYTIVYAGDGFTMFNDAKVITAGDASYLDSMLLTDYVVKKLGGTIGSQYAAAEGRLTIKTRFTDVPKTHWAYEFIESLAVDGIINGTSKTTYTPAGTLTWAQALKLLLVAHGDLKDVTGETWSNVTMGKAVELGLITDAALAPKPISRLDFCKAAAALYKMADSKTESIFSDCSDATVMAFVDAKVIGGYPDGTFRPEGTLNRAEIAKILYLLIK